MITAKLVTTSGGPALPYIRAEMKKLKDEIKSIEILLPIEIQKIGIRAGRFMADRVRRMTKRHGATGELATALENCMQFKKYGTTGFQVAMGVSSLPIYWAMVNYGGFTTPNQGFVYGNWDDGDEGKSDYNKRGGAGEGVFEAGKGGFLMIPRKPVKGFHYMYYAYSRIISEFRSGMFTRRVVKGMK